MAASRTMERSEIGPEQAIDEPAIDEELLAEAMRGLGTSSRNEAFNALVHDYVMKQRERRLAAWDRLQQKADEGSLDLDAIDKADD